MDSTPGLYKQLDSLITHMHLAGIPVVMAQFRGNEKKVVPDSSFARMNRALDGLKVYNKDSANVLGRFDGLMLDYEIWNDDYGNVNVQTHRYDSINKGWTYWQRLADSIITTSNNTAYHLPLSAVWVGNICSPDTILDLDGDGPATDSIDHRLMISKIDSFQFDRVVLSFFLTDKMDTIGFNGLAKDPTAFLLRTGNQAEWFNRLWYFGHDSLSVTSKNYPTNIIPNFHAGSDSNSTGINYKLERYLSGTGPYWPTHGGKHYLWQTETIFDEQYYDQGTFQPHFPNVIDTTWGSINIMKGFEWFKYQIGPLDYDSLSERDSDAIHSSHFFDVGPYARSGYYSFDDEKTEDEDQNLLAYPNPASNDFSIILKNGCDTNNLYVKCYDITGKDVTSNFCIDYQHCIINIKRIGLFKGIIICYIMDANLIRGSTKIILQ